MIIKKGIAISGGIAIGKCYLVDRNKVFITGYNISDVDREVAKFKAAVNYTSGIFDKLRYSNISGKINTELYDAYKLLLEDELFIGAAEAIIEKDKINAEFALKKVRDNFIQTMMSSDNEYLRDRLHDIEHIYQRMLRHMSNLKYEEFDEAHKDSIIISHDLTTSDIETIIKKNIKGFATDIGSKTSHNAILARSAGVVCVMGLENIYDSVSNEDIVIIDGFLGQVIINPDENILTGYKKRMEEYNQFISSVNTVKDTKCFTKSGESVKLYANIDNNGELTLLDVYGLEGIGLYRTEYIYINNGSMEEEEQYKIYSEAVAKLHGKPIVFRSFDLGGDKMSRYMPHPEEINPALGLRAIRYCLKYEPFFRTQLRALLRTSIMGDVRLLFPMISSVDEIIIVKNIINSECKNLEQSNIAFNKNIKIGIMIELPAAAICINKFFPYVDFFSLGTNDLIQYLIGIDRNNSNINYLYSPAHYSVINVLYNVLKNVSLSGKDISICGELAGDCRYIAMLLGIGYRSFSMNPRSSYMIRKVISKLEIIKCEHLVQSMCNASTVQEAEHILTEFNNKYLNNVDI